MVVIYKRDPENKTLIEVGRTEIVNNNLNPKYMNTFIFSYNDAKKEEL